MHGTLEDYFEKQALFPLLLTSYNCVKRQTTTKKNDGSGSTLYIPH